MQRKWRLFGYVFTASFIIQTLLIIYKDYSGYVPLRGIGHFLISVSSGTVISSVFMMIILLLDLKMINWLNLKFPWQKFIIKRIIYELPAASIVAVFISSAMTGFAHLLFKYDKPLNDVFIKNAIMVVIVNVLVIAVAEAAIFYNHGKQERIKSERLKRENLNLRFETLKKQLDPHFLFNSLNNLYALIGKDKEKAQEFIQEFSLVYRYTLDVIDKPVVSLNEEFTFVDSYLKLQKIRFNNAVDINMQVSSEFYDLLVPPLAVQTLLENAFKHNKATETEPLRIKIWNDTDFLYVSNSLQPKEHSNENMGIGFENLKKRYRLVSSRLPEIIITNDNYSVKLPFVETVKI
ncbi:MAG: histidine kinase [Calditrichae bacterium]|nr:histidine kinase [Calditrichota bacterium]MCB9057064.1 histidine kinase [Calditrichia bacterium]